MASFSRATHQYAAAVDAEQQGRLLLPDKNYDVGDFTPAGQYKLNDDTQAFWLHKLAEKKFAGVTPEMRSELLGFYSDLNAPFHTKTKPGEWKQTLAELDALKAQRMVSTIPQPAPASGIFAQRGGPAQNRLPAPLPQ